MTTLTLEIRQSYVKNIHHLFNGMIQAHENQMTDEVVEIVDKMFLEITTCHYRLAGFAMAAEMIGNALESLAPDALRVLIGQKTLDEYIMETGREWVKQLLPLARERNAYHVIEYLSDLWLRHTQTNQRMMVCINQARRNYHSTLVLALMGI